MEDMSVLSDIVAKFRTGSPNIAAAFDEVERRLILLETPAPPPPPPPSSGLRFALGTTGDMAGSATIGQSLGVKLMRSYDRSLTATVDSIVADCKTFQDRGIRPYLLYGIGSDFETKAPGLIGDHAAAVGPGGTRSHPTLPVEWFELGNEMFYNYKLDVTFGPAYARGFARCAQAVAARNPNVKCLFMLDVDAQGGAEYDRLVNGIYSAVPNIHTMVGGWVFHTYGPITSGGVTKVADLLSRVEAKGAPKDIPIFVTEDGIATDNGRTLQPHNYGWPLNATYAQAGALMRSKVRDLQALPWGSRVRVWTHYQARDGQPTGASTDKEAYFGVVQSNGQPKGDLTQSVRDHTAAYP